MIDLQEVLANLAQERPIFHSEADFQHALAWQLHKACPDGRLRLEYRIETSEPERALYLDIWMQTAQETLAIELKYLTRGFSVVYAGEHFVLKNHAAQNLRSYDVVKDISRIENTVATGKATRGYACVLTNAPIYWEPSRTGMCQEPERKK